MWMQDEIEKRKGMQPVKNLSQEIFDKQVKDIRNIAHLDGYKEIKRYWKEVRESSLNTLKIVKPEALATHQYIYGIADQFLNFLESLEKQDS